MADDTMRVIVINEREKMVASAFGGVIVDGDGSVRVGGNLASAHEVKPALSFTLSEIKDCLDEVFSDPSVVEDYLNRLLNGDAVALKQELFGIGLTEFRAQRAAQIQE